MISKLVIGAAALLAAFGHVSLNQDDVAGYCAFGSEHQSADIEYLLPEQAAWIGGDVGYLNLGVLRSNTYVAVRQPLPFLIPSESAWGNEPSLKFEAGDVQSKAVRMFGASRLILSHAILPAGTDRPRASETLAVYSYDAGLIAFSHTRVSAHGEKATDFFIRCSGKQHFLFDKLGPDRALPRLPAAKPIQSHNP